MSIIYQNQEKQILFYLINSIKSQNINEKLFLDTFTLFFKEKNNSFRELQQNEDLDPKDIENFTNLIKLGEIEFEYLYKLVFYACKIKDQLNYRTSKKKQYELAKKFLKLYNDDAAIFIFYDDNFNFRFSFIYAIYKGTKREFSYYKRFTYYVNPDLPYKTFIKQVGECNFSSIEEVKKAFSVEPVTKEFYKEIQNWYFWAFSEWKKGNIKFPLDNVEKSDYEEHIKINLIRLITRIIFIWFIKEKNIIPTKLFDKKELKHIVRDFEDSSNYYNAILQNLFFATLNTPIESRAWALDRGYPINKSTYGVKNLYRYEDMFLISKEEVLKLFKEIPFLNGGLFDCLDKEDENGKVIYVDGFTRNQNKRAIIPDYMFFKEEIKKMDLSKYGLSKNEEVRGLIEILKNYNFTTDEATEIDQEVALDPELLGKIFENLLASYNEETATTARKATGSFYTPREIVDYMITQSLKEYFKEKLAIKEKLPILKEEIIEKLLSPDDEEIEIEEDKKKKIIEAIYELRIIDPACGSGAFPMGILHKLVHILQKIDPDNRLWSEFILNKSIEEIEKLEQEENKDKIVEKENKDKIIKEIEEVFNENLNYPDYGRKLYLIERCIYGVDKQVIATQISRLRFFISLVIDQKVDKNKPNYGILPLPNLETNFISADSLIGLDKPKQGKFENKELAKLKKELKELRHRYFRIKDRNSKLSLQKKDREIREKIKKALMRDNWGEKVADKVALFDIFDQNVSADWFDSEWMFGITDGFDIVIGNPPYVSTKGVKDEYKEILQHNFGFADDLYNHFYHKAIQILKENGILAFISSKTFWTIKTKKNLRELILKYKLIKLVDTSNPFESSMVDTCITIIKKTEYRNYEIEFIDATKGLQNKRKYLVKDEVYRNTINNVFFVPTDFNLRIYNKYNKKIKELVERWSDKISTSKNIEKNKRELERYRQSLKPGDITLLGLITEGGVGIQTGDNGKYIGVLEGTKWADKVRQERPQKLWEFIQNKNPQELKHLKSKAEVEKFLKNLSEQKIRNLFDELKEKYGRDIFGQGWLYRIVSKEEIADVETLTEEEKLNGIEGIRTFVPYDKGDKEGNRWWAPTPYYIDWSKQNVKFLKENSGKKGEGMPVVRNPQFFFKEGFCWTDVSYDIRCRIKERSIHDVLSMSLFCKSSKVNEKFIICLLNSNFMSLYLNTFVNTTVHFQINDARQLPIVIPTQEQLKEFESICDKAIDIQKRRFSGQIRKEEAKKQLDEIQKELDEKVIKLYGL